MVKVALPLLSVTTTFTTPAAWAGVVAVIDVPLTTVHYAADIVSDLAVKRLLLLIAALDRLPDPEVTLIEPELVIRASCGADRSQRRGDANRVTPAVSPSTEPE